MHFNKRRQTPSSFLDITPVVDTVFNLLIFFALSLSFIATPAIQVDLPRATAPELDREQKDLRLVITHAGRVFLNQKELSSADELEHSFRTAAMDRIPPQLFIEADERVPHGKVVEIMDVATNAGLQRLAIVTRSKHGKGL